MSRATKHRTASIYDTTIIRCERSTAVGETANTPLARGQSAICPWWCQSLSILRTFRLSWPSRHHASTRPVSISLRSQSPTERQIMVTNIITAVVTAYCACQTCCGPNAKGTCANGKKPIQGVTIAGPRRLPFGTIVEVSGHRYIVQDRLAKRYDTRFDIFMSNHAEARRFGIQTNLITVITHENPR